MPEGQKEENFKESPEKKTKKKKSSKAAEGKEKVEEQVTPSLKETIEEKVTDEKEKEKSNVETTDTENLQDVSTAKKKSLDVGSLFKNTKIREEVGKEDLMKLFELREAFQLFDFNRDGIIDLEDLKFTFVTMGRPDVSEEHLKQMLSEMPSPVNFDSFVSVFGRKVTEMDPEEVFTAALSTWDMRDTGMIPEEKIRDDLQKFGDKFTLKDVDSALEEAPVYLQDGNAMIDYVKFSNNICGFRNLIKAREQQQKSENA
ncbi:hypothetical protein KPH14_006412 [Odynerus spinipes]|uniref:EF-hand domain-containing protein n=1 Tax=Odynerus spinipes TaxID=1348599 RepID=A0AAD9VVL4_9HYME|nr:hypothetical protein KPH14_006412 [Odynerus spinipes]